MDATMMHEPLGTAAIVAHGERIHATSRIGVFDGEQVTWRSFGETAERARRLAAALRAADVGPNTRVATLSWNDFAHFEAYLAVPAMGAVLHTLNLRLHPEQIHFIMADAEDALLIAHGPLLAGLLPQVNSLDALRHVIVTGDTTGLAGLEKPWTRYEDFIGGHVPLAEFPVPDEMAAAATCYTSGTTGNPKGVVYSHRTIFLHSLASMAANAFALSDRDMILLLPPMFHANAWGLPYSGWLAGADFVLPGPHLQPEAIRRMSAPPCRRSSSTGSAVSEGLIAEVESRWNVPLIQGWGMTETSPLCVLSHPAADTAGEEARHLRAQSGRPVAGVSVRLVDDTGR